MPSLWLISVPLPRPCWTHGTHFPDTHTLCLRATQEILANRCAQLPLDDDSNNLILDADPPLPVRTTWTLLLYLTSASEGCVGGETVFYTNDRKLAREEIAVPLETGMLLLHKHGDDCLLVRLPLSTFSLPPPTVPPRPIPCKKRL